MLLSLLLVYAGAVGLLLPPAVGAGGAALAASSGVSPYKVPSGPQAYCDPCDIRSCPNITPELCNGTLVKDDCGCCPRCDQNQRPTNQTSTVISNHTCADINCRGSEMCVLNIQGIPICRCPSPFWCRRQDRREVCGRDGRTYPSKCYLKVAECTNNQKIRVAHRGVCVSKAEAKEAKKTKRKEQRERESLRESQRDREVQRRKRRRKKAKRVKSERGQEGRPKRDHSVNNHKQGGAERRFRFQRQQSTQV